MTRRRLNDPVTTIERNTTVTAFCITASLLPLACCPAINGNGASVRTQEGVGLCLDLGDGVEMMLVRIPAGDFIMCQGAPKIGYSEAEALESRPP